MLKLFNEVFINRITVNARDRTLTCATGEADLVRCYRSFQACIVKETMWFSASRYSS